MSDFIDKIKVSVGGKDIGSKIGKVFTKGASGVRAVVKDVKTVLTNDEKQPEPINLEDDSFDIDLTSMTKDHNAPVEEKPQPTRKQQEEEQKDSPIVPSVTAIKDAIDAKMSDIARSTRELKDNVVGASARYEELTNEIKGVVKTTEESQEQLESMSDKITGVKSLVDEIHSTTNSIDKLYDSVFELKATNVELRKSISGLKKLVLAFGITALALAVIAIALGVMDVVIIFTYLRY